jgi:GT2 family glycosyltransferase
VSALESIRPLVVVVAFHNTDDLRICLADLDGWGELVVVDNGGDTAVERLAAAVGGSYVNPGSNVGFAAAVNLALQRRRPSQHALLLNPDARLTPADADRLLAKLETSPRLAAVAPTLSAINGEPQRTTWPVPSPREVWTDAVGLRRWLRPRAEFVVGAVLLLRAEALNQVGDFDDRFFLYAEECDWQFRAQRLGWTVASVGEIVVPHAGGASSADNIRREVLFHRSGEAFGRKWYGSGGWLVMRAGSVVGAAGRWLASRDPSRRREHALRLRLYTTGAGRP